MLRIVLVEWFWSLAIMTGYELYQYPDTQKKVQHSECLGAIWGVRDGDDLYPVYGTATRLIVNREEGPTIGPDPFAHSRNNFWAALDATDAEYLGTFHTFPWSPDEVERMLANGCVEEAFYEPSEEEKGRIIPGKIEITLSYRPIDTVAEEEHSWAQRGLILAGRIDEAHVTFSGWYKHANHAVEQIPIEYTNIDEANRRIPSRL